MKHKVYAEYRFNLYLSLIMAMLFIFCNEAIAVGKEVYKPTRVIQKTEDHRDIDITIAELTYDDNGNLVRFISYQEGREYDPRDDVSLEWSDNQVIISGFTDCNHNLTGTVYLNEQGLASHISIFDDYDGDLDVDTDIDYNNNKLLHFDSSDIYSFEFGYDNNELSGVTRYYRGNPNENLISFSYDNSDASCNIPFPAIWYNCTYYHRYLAYAGLWGQPMNSLPSAHNCYDNGWVDFDYSFDENGNVTSISSQGGFTHSFDYEEFTYEYALTSSIDKKLTDKITVNTEGCSIVIRGKDSGCRIQIFNLAGQLLKSTQADRIAMGQRGVYILKIGNSYQKVIL